MRKNILALSVLVLLTGCGIISENTTSEESEPITAKQTTQDFAGANRSSLLERENEFEYETEKSDLNYSYEADLAESKKNETPDYYSDIEDLMNNYCYFLCEAINEGDYSIVEPYILNGSPLETAQKKLVDNLYDKGTEEEFVNASINEINMDSDNINCSVFVTETEVIYYSDGSSDEKTFNWEYKASYNNNSWQLSDIK